MEVNVVISACSYRPTLPVSYVTQILGFENETLCSTFLKDLKVVFVDQDETKIDCKASTSVLPIVVATPSA